MALRGGDAGHIDRERRGLGNQAVLDPNGTPWGCCEVAAAAHGVSVSRVRNWVRKRRHGWRWASETDALTLLPLASIAAPDRRRHG